MTEAVRLAEIGIEKNHGGPFGCVIVLNEEIVGRGWNQVISTNDPTAHAEVMAIRDACKKMGVFHLPDCELYTSCEPCPMCLGAIYWSQIKLVYFANNKNDAAAIGFNDSFIYDEMMLSHENRKIKMIALENEGALKLFEKWKLKNDKTLY
jgi:tRNA(Arg) A34 adenosine deaminase TadA